MAPDGGKAAEGQASPLLAAIRREVEAALEELQRLCEALEDRLLARVGSKELPSARGC